MLNPSPIQQVRYCVAETKIEKSKVVALSAFAWPLVYYRSYINSFPKSKAGPRNMQSWSVALTSLSFLSFIPSGIQVNLSFVQRENRSIVKAPHNLSPYAGDGLHGLSPRQPILLGELDWHVIGYETPIFPLLLAGTVASLGALRGLVMIYKTILDGLLVNWASSTLKNQVIIEAGSLRWEFECTVYPIPNSFIEEYTKSKLDAVNRGFAPLFAKEWWFMKSDKTRYCYAGMRIGRDGEIIVPPNSTLRGW